MGVKDAFKKLGGALKHMAPVLGNIIETGTPGGPLVGTALRAVAAAVGSDSEDPDVLANQVAIADPATAAAIREADQTFQLEMRKLDIALYRVDQKDRESARAMQTATRSKLVPTLAITAVVGLIGFIAFASWLSSTQWATNVTENLIYVSIGVLANNAAQVYSFYFGSSAGGEETGRHLVETIRNGRQ